MRNDTILVVVLEDQEKDCARLKNHIKRYSQEHSVDIEILTGRSGEFNLIYKQKNKEDIIQKVIIKSL